MRTRASPFPLAWFAASGMEALRRCSKAAKAASGVSPSSRTRCRVTSAPRALALRRMQAAGLPLPAYDQVCKASHSFNLLDARRAISVTERQRYILRVRALAQAVAKAYYAQREKLGFPGLKSAGLNRVTVSLDGLDDATFRAMKPSAIFINVGRGSTVVTDDLVEALRCGDIAGAGLEVMDPEPLPDGHPLWDMPNVVITPHLANPPYSVRRRIGSHTVQVMERYSAGEAIPTEVDIQAGY